MGTLGHQILFHVNVGYMIDLASLLLYLFNGGPGLRGGSFRS
jgi:hypothetical protein